MGSKSHQQLTMAILEKTQQNTVRKQAKIFTPLVDPEKEKELRIKV